MVIIVMSIILGSTAAGAGAASSAEETLKLRKYSNVCSWQLLF